MPDKSYVFSSKKLSYWTVRDKKFSDFVPLLSLHESKLGFETLKKVVHVKVLLTNNGRGLRSVENELRDLLEQAVEGFADVALGQHLQVQVRQQPRRQLP